MLGRAVVAAGFEWHDERAHSSLYDAEVTAKLFCTIVNRFRPVYAAAIGDPKAAGRGSDPVPLAAADEREPPTGTGSDP